LGKNRHLLTIISNINYYGYMPSKDAIEALSGLDTDALATWWKPVEKALKSITADDRKMDDFVVYQNFPAEVLEMSQAEYWCKQILMYFGFDKDYFRQEKIERDPLFEDAALKVLHLADERALYNIYNSLLDNKSRWTVPQTEQMMFLLADLNISHFTTSKASFRENGIHAVNWLMDNVKDANIIVEDATDVLRLAALRSGSDKPKAQPRRFSRFGRVAVTEEKAKPFFKNFSRSERRALCRMLETSKHLEADMAERPALFKLLLRRLHPGDFKYARLCSAYDALYNGRLRSYASKVEAAIREGGEAVFDLLKQRPGEFVRRFHHLQDAFGGAAVQAFTSVMPKMTTHQLLKLVRYAQTINDRKYLAFPPRGNWSKLQVVENKKKPLLQENISLLETQASSIISERLRGILPEGFDVDPMTDLIKLQTNDQELAPYGRGTVFPIPEEMTYIRSGSYWQVPCGGTIWYDNGWNFFDADWNAAGVLCWDRTDMGGAAAFSGDPLSSKDKEGRACQVIDLYIDKLLAKGIRYAVWNILCFSNKPFSYAKEVVATLQWGEKAQAGAIFEPSRAQFVSPVTGDSKTKYILYVDLVDRKMVYMDANLKGQVRSASANGTNLSQQMPAFVEYLGTLPSVKDLFQHADGGSIPVVYSDREREIVDKQRAYVFRPENEENSFQQLDLARFL
jgi:hypothetical protein